MSTLKPLYRHSLSLFNDLYELTMAYAYWKSGNSRKEAVFNLYFRKPPFQGGFTLACGLSYVIDYLNQFKFSDDDLAYLAELTGIDGTPLFDAPFLTYLKEMKLTLDVDAMPEGTPAFAHQPLVRVQGPIVQCQLMEAPLLNMINFQTLIATKAARITIAAQGDRVFEFGLRRAQGIDGALAASRAAYIGGFNGTSNVLAGKLFGIPVKGTHAHSWVMSFDDELEAFRQYAKAMPNNCIFLVDTYDSLNGIRKAVEVGKWLRENGHEMGGIRLDSGDLAYLSIEARRILNEAGFPEADIVASNDLDEHIIASLKQQGAAIDVWAVGTKVATAFDQPALGAVYKLSAVREPGGKWEHKVKLSEQAVKTSTPGIQQVRRFLAADGQNIADVIYDLDQPIHGACQMVDPLDMTRRKIISDSVPYHDLLIPIFRNGEPVYQAPSASEARAFAQKELNAFHSGVKRFINPHQYPVGLEQSLHALRTELILRNRVPSTILPGVKP